MNEKFKIGDIVEFEDGGESIVAKVLVAGNDFCVVRRLRTDGNCSKEDIIGVLADELRKLPPTDQKIKADAGKPRLSLVPLEILPAIARVREYGITKYGDSEGWRKVKPERYIDALFRHLVAFVRDPSGLDKESGLPHLWHVATNVAFLCEIYKDKFAKVGKEKG